MQIQIIDDFLTDADITPVTNLIQAKGYTFGWPSNDKDQYGHWNCMFAGKLSANRISVEDELPIDISKLWTKIKQQYLPEYTVVRAYSNSYTYGTEGYLHTDSSIDDDRTVLVYLNTEWKRDWAGETVFFDGDDIVKSCLPKFGRIVVFPSSMEHVARAVSRACTTDRQIFAFKARLTAEKFDPLLQTTQIKHTGRLLSEHLANTYNLLKKLNIPEYVCVAGGIHSIYGTNAFKTATFDIDQHRHKIQEYYGEQAEHLAYLFCSINRPECLETGIATNWRTKQPIELTAQELEYLRLIEAANLIEQKNGIADYPETYKTWTEYQMQSR
jgi:SM-20-related protein